MQKYFPGLVIILLFSCSREIEFPSPLNKIETIANRVISETAFAFELNPQTETHGLQILDFGEYTKSGIQQTFIAVSEITSKSDTSLLLGLSYAGEIRLLIDDSLIFNGILKENYTFREYTYDRFNFDNELPIPLKKGKNRITLELTSAQQNCLTILRVIDKLGNQEPSVIWNKFENVKNQEGNSWIFLGPLSGEELKSSNTIAEKIPIDSVYSLNSQFYPWKQISVRLLRSLVIPENAVFKKEPYADWHYGIGTVLLSFQDLSQVSGDEKYKIFIKEYYDFALNNFDYIKFQHDSMIAIRGSFHRLARLSMLDDCGAPATALLQLQIERPEPAYDSLINSLSSFIAHNQYRLDDGTFCRPEPVPYTIWADDLFMSVPFMLRMGKISSDSIWYNDVVMQILNFNQYLKDPQTGLYRHGWFDSKKEYAPVAWCRANGWVAWALAEALLYLPADYPGYDKILAIFKENISALKNYQSETGLWHQVLDDNDSYLETSGSAMFTLAMARGIRNNWLGEEYKPYVMKAWTGIDARISNDGIVKGICRGTSIGDSPEFYNSRETFDNDSRGLGAVITAGIEVHLLLKRTSKGESGESK